jgi:polyisoprenoid-binding protein YceI
MKWRGWIVLVALLWPAAGWAESYTINPAKSRVGFSVGFTFGTVRGAFEQFQGQADLDHGHLHSVTGAARAESINTNNSRRDGHLRSDHFFAASKYPEIAFRSTSVEPAADGAYQVKGDLTIRGVTHAVLLTGNLEPADTGRFVFRAAGKINRKDWGIVWNQHVDGMDLFIHDEVAIALEGELAKAN